MTAAVLYANPSRSAWATARPRCVAIRLPAPFLAAELVVRQDLARVLIGEPVDRGVA